MAATQLIVDTQHQDMIHDVQADYYGKTFATASSDRSVRIFNAADGALLKELTGHNGPVWQVAWAHPKFGNILADCSYDCRVFIWKEEAPGNWVKIFEDSSHESSVNAVAWAPHSLGLILAAASSDGTISIFTYQESTRSFQPNRFMAHAGGVNAVSWAPDVPSGALLAQQAPPKPVKRLVSGGCDNRILIWSYNEQMQRWDEEQKIFDKNDNAHADWVRDVAWAPSLGLPSSTIASASEDKTVIIWTEEPNGMFKKANVLRFETKVWRVSWSVMGNVLAVSQGDNKVSLWKESLDGTWKNLTSVAEPDAAAFDAKASS